MRAPSTHWFKELLKSRVRDDSDEYPYSIYPWVAPPLHPRLREVIERWGIVRELAAHDSVLGNATDRVDQVVLVQSGITVRHFGSPYAQAQSNHAFSLPGRLACGNLNFFTHFPCVGRYYALVPSTVSAVSQKLLWDLCRKDSEFLLLLAKEFEMIALSDRLGFGAQIMLNIEDRVLAYLLSWAVMYGELETEGGIDWVCMPVPVRGVALQNIVVCSSAALERAVGSLKKKGVYEVNAAGARVRLDALKPVHNWIRSQEEISSARPRALLDTILS